MAMVVVAPQAEGPVVTAAVCDVANVSAAAAIEPEECGSSRIRESQGFGRLAAAETPSAAETEDKDAPPPPSPEELRQQRYERMLRRAGYAPKKHIEHLERMQHNRGADAMKLGAVSGQQYKDILRSRAFDEFFFQIPAPKGALENMPEVARKILSKDPAADDQHRKDEEQARHELGGGHYEGVFKGKDLKEEVRLSRIGFKRDLYGPPGLAQPQKKILNSEGREKFFSYDGDWEDGRMHGFGTYRFADGTTYEGVMRDNWPCGEGTARYPNGGVYIGRWKEGKCQGYGRLTSPTGSVYEGSWLEGRRSGKGKLQYKSGSKYEGDFLLGLFHGRGRFESANLNVSYDGWWASGFLCGYGTLIMPDGFKIVRAWPTQSRFGGGLSLRGAMELVQYEKETLRLDKFEQREALYGVAQLAELHFRVNNVRQEIAERRAEDKAGSRAELAAKRRAARLAQMEAKLKALVDEEKAAELDDIEKELL